MSIKITSVLIGIATGFFGGLLGMGGAFISIPAMITFLHLDRHRAHATSLAVIGLMSAFAGTYYWASGNADLHLAGLLLIGSAAGVTAGAKIMHRIPVRTLGMLFGIFVVVIAVKMGLDANEPVHYATGVNALSRNALIVLAGLLSGVLSGLLGVGGAVVCIPALVYLSGATQQVAQGIVLLTLIPTSFIGSYTHWKNGYIDLSAAPWLALGTALSSLAGAHLAIVLPASYLRVMFSLIVLLVGIQTFASSVGRRGRGEIKGQGEGQSPGRESSSPGGPPE